MTRERDANLKWRMFCDRCRACSEPFDREPDLKIFVGRGWFIAKLFGDLCPICVEKAERPTAEPHSFMEAQ